MRDRPHLALGGFFLFAGAMHFAKPRWYEAIMPPYLPAHRELVYASGVAELAGGAGALHPRTRALAGWWLIATLLAILPANIHVALHPEDVGGAAAKAPRWALYARLPGQALFIAWAWRATRPQE